jgi:rod shape-determining protein MreD
MSNQSVIKSALVVLLYLALQVLFVRNLVFYDVAFCFIYLIAILWLPGEMDSFWVILVSFLIGIVVDMFYNTAGVHAAACTLIGFLRKGILQYFFPAKAVENNLSVTLKELGYQRYFVYITAIVFIHHVALFIVEAGGFHLFLKTIVKILSSTVFTVLVIYLGSIFTSNISSDK